MSVHRIGVLDAWRGVAVSLVVTGHLFIGRINSRVADGSFASLRAGHPQPGAIVKAFIWRLSETGALLGLSIFFVISGYLITSIMADEAARTGSVSLTRFYVRRVCRIVPAMAVFVVGCVVLAAFGQAVVEPEAVLLAATFTCDIVHHCGWNLGHLWSLALEEQFYLIWPVAFVVYPQHRCRLARATAIIAFASLWFVGPGGHDVASGLACIASGMLYAIDPRVRHWIQGHADGRWTLVAIATFLLQAMVVPASLLARPLACAAPLMACLVVVESLNPASATRRIIDRPFLRYIGLCSYSLYLWQQIFPGRFATEDESFLRITVLLIPVALICYRFIELPAIRFGRRATLSVPVVTAFVEKTV